MKNTIYIKRRKRISGYKDQSEYVEQHYLASGSNESEFEKIFSEIMSGNHDHTEILEPGDSMMTANYVMILYDRNDSDITDISVFKIQNTRIFEKEMKSH